MPTFPQLIECDVSGMKYSRGERKRGKSAEARLALHVSDILIASMIIPPRYTPLLIFIVVSNFHYALHYGA